MVQWVSIPAETQEAEGDTYGVKPRQFQHTQPSGFAGLLDNFQVMQTIRQRI